MYAAISIDAEVPVAFQAPGDIEEIIAASERNDAPLTWLLYSSTTRPEEAIRYYHDHVLHKIPGHHELGLHVHFDDHELKNYEPDPARRKELILRGAAILRKYHVKPTSFRAGCWCLQPCDTAVLEEIGILVDSSPCPGYPAPHRPAHGGWAALALRDPYHPSYTSLFERGDAKLTVIPICSSLAPNASGACESGYLEYRGWDGLKPLLDAYIKDRRYISLGAHDGRSAARNRPSAAEAMDRAVPYLREHGYEMVTLTHMRDCWVHGA